MHRDQGGGDLLDHYENGVGGWVSLSDISFLLYV